MEIIEASRRLGWIENILEEIPKVLQERIYVIVVLWQEDARILWTLIGSHENEGLWKEVLGVGSLCEIHRRIGLTYNDVSMDYWHFIRIWYPIMSQKNSKNA